MYPNQRGDSGPHLYSYSYNSSDYQKATKSTNIRATKSTSTNTKATKSTNTNTRKPSVFTVLASADQFTPPCQHHQQLASRLPQRRRSSAQKAATESPRTSSEAARQPASKCQRHSSDRPPRPPRPEPASSGSPPDSSRPRFCLSRSWADHRAVA